MHRAFYALLGGAKGTASGVGYMPPFRYGAAMLVVALVFVVRLELQPVLESRAPFILFTISVMVSAWYGGLGPGLLATFLGTAAGFFFFLMPADVGRSADRLDWLLILLSVLTGVAISILSGSMHSARARAERSAQEVRRGEERYRRMVAASAEQARRSQEFKSAILDAVAHDMKTPLTSIKAAVTCLMGKGAARPRERAELLSVINEETDHLNRLVTEVIDTARVEVGRLHLQKGPHYLRETISAALDEIKPKAAGRPVEVELTGTLAPADIDFQLVKQVFKQLLDNAIKYSPEGSPLKILCRPSGDRIVVDVADSGPGIPEEEQDRIFDEFYRVPGKRERASGTGMGLFIAKRIVDAHGGRIWVTSKPGSGSTFHVALPVYGRSLS